MPKDPKSKVHASQLTPRQRIGRTQLQLAIAGRDQFGVKYKPEDRKKLLRSAAKNMMRYVPDE
jgi:hypothetical protein